MSAFSLTDDYKCVFNKPEVPLELRDIIAFVTVHNEALRLPYFLNYYRRLGVNKFFIIDNNSTDSTPDILKKQSDVIYFFSPTKAIPRARLGVTGQQN